MLATYGGWRYSPPKMMPLDPDPVENGNVVIEPPDGAIPARARVLKKGEAENLPEGTLRYRSHFATCSEADKFRRR
jgi:hypothetical protein